MQNSDRKLPHRSP